MSEQLDIFADRYPASPGFKVEGPSKDAAKAMKPKAGTLREGVLACLQLAPMTPDWADGDDEMVAA